MDWARSMISFSDGIILHGLIFFEAKNTRKAVRLANPKGIEAFSPGLRGTSYPGKTMAKNHHPQGGCGRQERMEWRDLPQPVPGGGLFVVVTQNIRGGQP